MGELLAALVRSTMGCCPSQCVELLQGLIRNRAARQGGREEALREVAEAAVAGLDEIGKTSATRQDYHWAHREDDRPLTAALVGKLLSALGKLGAQDLREAAARRISARPDVFDPVTIVVPALGLVTSQKGAPARMEGALLHLWTHSAEFLLKRSEIPPEAPSDWRQNVKLSCSCADCRELQAFVLDPVEPIHRFRVRQDRRQHLHQMIERHGLDMTHVTDRKGSPQTLVCTKDRRNYRRRCEEYRKDISALAALAEQTREDSAECASQLKRIETARLRAGNWSPA